MPNIQAVDDPDDPRVADYVGLKDAELRRRREVPAKPDGQEPGLFIAEGAIVLRRLIASPYRMRSVLLTAKRYGPLAGDLAAVSAPVYLASQAVMNAVVGFDIHRGVLAAAERRRLPEVASLLAASRRVAVLEDLVDHENLGVIFRNAAALGVDAILLSPACADPLYRRSVRVSMGHVLSVPYAVIDPWPDGLAAVAAAGFLLVALTPDPAARDIRELDLPSHDRVGMILGAEGPGLSSGALATAVPARIAMRFGVDSLNVASAAAIAFHAAMGSPVR